MAKRKQPTAQEIVAVSEVVVPNTGEIILAEIEAMLQEKLKSADLTDDARDKFAVLALLELQNRLSTKL